jgi:multidrug efflux pump subunit AcrA (membrane-fusion protein)
MKLKALVSLGALLGLVLAGCGALGQATPTPLPTVVLNDNANTPQPTAQDLTGGVTASGVVAIARSANLGFMVSGEVKSVNVAVNDKVKAGQVLASLAGDESIQASLSAANLAILTAQQSLTALNNGAQLAAAKANLDVVQAQKTLRDAKTHRLAVGSRGTAEQIAAANANYILAQDHVNDLQKIYNSVSNRPENDAGRALALSNLEAAKVARDRALINLNWYKGTPDPKDIAEADAQVAIAQAQLDVAQAQLDKVKNGPDPDQVALIQAQIKSAQDQAAAAQANLETLQLKAPFDATVNAVNVSADEIAVPGQVLFVLIDDARLHVETTDLSERDVVKVAVGQPVKVQVEALNQMINGKVSSISNLADTLGGDVVYTTDIALDSQPAGLREGMSVTVTFNTSP